MRPLDAKQQAPSTKPKDLLVEIFSIPGSQFRKSPCDGAWSVGGILAHLQQVESSVLAGANKAVSRVPVHLPWTKRSHLLLRLTT
jgi:hypothetical protein